MRADAQQASGDVENYLKRIETIWENISVVVRHPDDKDYQKEFEVFFRRYNRAIALYVIRKVDGESQVADDIIQDFVLRLLQGGFRTVERLPGSFRFYVCTVLDRLVIDYYRKHPRNAPRPLAEYDVGVTDAELESDQKGIEVWRGEFRRRAMDQLAQTQPATGSPFFHVLDIRGSKDEMSSEELAAQLSERLGRLVKIGTVRKTLHDARSAYGPLLIREVATSLGEPTREQLEQELITLRLHEHLKPYLDKFIADRGRGTARPTKDAPGKPHQGGSADESAPD